MKDIIIDVDNKKKNLFSPPTKVLCTPTTCFNVAHELRLLSVFLNWLNKIQEKDHTSWHSKIIWK